MTDVFTVQKRSEVMAKIQSKNTLIERKVFTYLRLNNVYFRRHYDKIVGKPDIALPREKRAIFLDGDFWHGRDYNIRSKTLPPYWKLKIAANIERDKKNRTKLKKLGWRVLQVWEQELEKKEERTLNKIRSFLTEK